MRLLERNSAGELSLTKDFIGDNIPEYAILSHTWGADTEEVTFQDMMDGTGKDKSGYKKICCCGEQAKRDGLQYFWVDTCCIDKSSSAVLSEAIISMFRWYYNATQCYVYLSDISRLAFDVNGKCNQLPWESAIQDSKWFTRGWTLQELLAPTAVKFFSKDWEQLGDKKSLERHIHDITGIPVKALQGSALSNFSFSERLSWAEKRDTTREEDKAYSLLGIFHIQMPVLYGEGGENAFKRLREEINKTSKGPDNNLLHRLPYAVEAPFNSYHRQHEPTCLPDTRVDLLQEIYDWADGQEERCIFWLNGLAGTGKSTIARTVAQKYNEHKRLGASFFFSRDGGDVGHAEKCVASIAVQLASSVPTLHQHICNAVSEDSNIASKGLRDQWNQLIFRPLSQLDGRSVQPSLIIVIDALDECEGEDDVQSVLQLLAEANNLGAARLLVFLTSRPETPVRLGFRAMPGFIHHDLVLHHISRATVDHDIATFLRDRFREMREEFEELPAIWPEDDKIEYLVERADGLFIYAATVCRFIKGDGQWLPQDLLGLVIPDARSGQLPEWERDVPSQSPTWKLDEIYTQILRRSVQGGRDKDRTVQTLKQVIGSFAILAEPLPAATLANLLQMRPEAVNIRIQHLHSVLNVPRNPDHPIRLLHPSFRDFLFDKHRCHDQSFWVEEKQANRTLAVSCIRFMSAFLKQDICNVDAPGMLVAGVEGSRVNQCLPPEVQYACLYWIQHVRKSGAQLCDNDQIHQFLKEHFLHWLEALSWMRKVSEGIRAITSLESIASISDCPDLYSFLHDMKRFALYSRSGIEQVPLQVYCGALAFAPTMSIVKRQFKDQMPRWLQSFLAIEKGWNAMLQTLEGHWGWVYAVAFSPDGKVLASASSDETVSRVN
ncbi:HET-domain-containing protein [Zopfia rhizophila CBS 207.26]|uniref:HET-domain-containing protein n=1 Tax=Zopfia rhizophila CBS 207.26 TaxID=1314779 RepID=A0A6A6DLB4_9PEZI|nr:HET-domain-containing protein [Zopfia rhizophila CBS 207.26]